MCRAFSIREKLNGFEGLCRLVVNCRMDGNEEEEENKSVKGHKNEKNPTSYLTSS